MSRAQQLGRPPTRASPLRPCLLLILIVLSSLPMADTVDVSAHSLHRLDDHGDPRPHRQHTAVSSPALHDASSPAPEPPRYIVVRAPDAAPSHTLAQYGLIRAANQAASSFFEARRQQPAMARVWVVSGSEWNAELVSVVLLSWGVPCAAVRRSDHLSAAVEAMPGVRSRARGNTGVHVLLGGKYALPPAETQLLSSLPCPVRTTHLPAMPVPPSRDQWAVGSAESPLPVEKGHTAAASRKSQAFLRSSSAGTPLAAIVLGNEPMDQFHPTIDLVHRTLTALHFAASRPGVLIMASGGATAGGSMTEAGMVGLVALSRGFPEKRFILESRARTTVENARFTSEYMLDKGITESVIVSKPSHLKWAMSIFQSLPVFFNTKPLPTPTTRDQQIKQMQQCVSYVTAERQSRIRDRISWLKSGTPGPD